MKATCLLGAVLLLPLADPAVADEKTLLSVDEIIERHLEARGGPAKIRALRTVVYSQGLYEEGDYTGSGEAFMALARPYYKVVGDPDQPGDFMEGYDGGAWEWFADPGIVIRTVGAAAAASRHGAALAGPFLDYRDRGTSIELGGLVEIGGRPAYRLIVTYRDGFVGDYFIDRESFLVTAERKSAPIHAFGEPVTSETRAGDYREVADVLFAHSYVETEIATGEILHRMQWGKIEANRDLPAAWFSPPVFERTELQHFLERLYGERTDKEAVLWSYHDFRRAHPEIDTRQGVELVGYQLLKMGDVEEAIALLEANVDDHPQESSAAFGLGRAYSSAGDDARARTELERALRLDPENRRAKRALDELASELEPAT